MEPLNLGSFALPWELIWAFAGWATFRIWLKFHETDATVRKFWSERLSWAVLIGLLVWKITPVVTSWDAVLSNPLMLLYLSGGLPGILGGVATAAGIVGMSLFQMHKERQVSLVPELASMGAGLGLFMVLLFGVPMLVGTPAPKALTTEQQQASLFLLPSFQGGSHALADYRGKLAIVNFWASWCPPCRAEFPEFREAFSHLPKWAVLVGVAQTGTEKNGPADSQAFFKSQKADWVQLSDADGSLAKAFGVQALPTTLVLNSQGLIVARHVGAVDQSWLLSIAQKFKPKALPLPK